jgi:hypothetical protein
MRYAVVQNRPSCLRGWEESLNEGNRLNFSTIACFGNITHYDEKEVFEL